MSKDLRLLAIAGPPTLDPARLVEACLAAEAGGVTAIQLRLKSSAAAEMLALAQELSRQLTVPLWINDRADVALVAQARGVHVGWNDIPPSAVRAFAGDRLQVGVSVGDPTEARRALAEPVDYWSIGAMFATNTKRDAGVPIGPTGFRALAAMAPGGMPTIAIGGISVVNVDAVLKAGAHGVAVSHAVFGASDVRRAAEQLREVIDRYHFPRASGS